MLQKQRNGRPGCIWSLNALWPGIYCQRWEVNCMPHSQAPAQHHSLLNGMGHFCRSGEHRWTFARLSVAENLSIGILILQKLFRGSSEKSFQVPLCIRLHIEYFFLILAISAVTWHVNFQTVCFFTLTCELKAPRPPLRLIPPPGVIRDGDPHPPRWWRSRACCLLPVATEAVVGKGMLVVADAVGNNILLQDSCVKVRWRIDGPGLSPAVLFNRA